MSSGSHSGLDIKRLLKPEYMLAVRRAKQHDYVLHSGQELYGDTDSSLKETRCRECEELPRLMVLMALTQPWWN